MSRYRRHTLLVVIVSMVALAMLFVLEVRRRRDLYWFDVQSDYRYRFSGHHVTSLPVEVSSQGVVVLPAQLPWDTAVLRIHIAGSWTSRWFEPSITISNGSNKVDQQFFDRGAQGNRYLVLTRDIIPPSNEIQLQGSHLGLSSQTGQLLLFNNPSPASGRVPVLAPHPDDAEIAAFGLYSTTDSFVVTITAGNYVDGTLAHLAADKVAQDTLKADVRTWDSLVVPTWGGVSPQRTANLGYLGTSLAHLYAERDVAAAKRTPADSRFGRFRRGALDSLVPGRIPSASWESLVEDLVVLMAAVRPAIVVAPHPSLDISEDHQLTTVALLEALERADNDNVTLFLYTNHHVLSEYFPFGPGDAGVPMPPWFDESIQFSSVYSARLDEARQIDKLFALDAMHDLREAPRRLFAGPTDRFLGRIGRFIADIARDPVSDYSYYRRAARPNELFFVYRAGDRQALRRAATRAETR